MFQRILLATALLWASQASAQCITVLVTGVNSPPQTAANLRSAQAIVNEHGCTSGGLNQVLVQTDGATVIGGIDTNVIINRPTHIRGLHGGERHRVLSTNQNSPTPIEVNARAIIENLNITYSPAYYQPRGGIRVNAGGSTSELRGIRTASFIISPAISINGADGVLVAPSDQFPVEIFGGASPGDLITGIRIQNAFNTTIRGAHIGTTAAGQSGVSQSNSGWGIEIANSTLVTIGGSRTNASQRNIIANNRVGAISINNSSLVNIWGNSIGVLADGVTLSANGTNSATNITQRGGIFINNSSAILIGDINPGRSNVLVADREGITVANSNAVFVRDNFIGVRLDGQVASLGGNVGAAIVVRSDSGHSDVIQIGGSAGQGNMLGSTSARAIRVEDGAGQVTIRRNEIWQSNLPLIERNPPPQAPVITFVDSATGVINGSITPVSSAGEVDVFMDPGNMARQYLGTVAVPANASSFSLSVTPGIPLIGHNLRATFTRSSGTGAGTSAMSEAFPINEVMRNLVVLRSGQGTITSVPAGINCGASCSTTFASGTPVTLSAVAAPGWNFVGWGGAGGACTGTSATCVINMTADRVASASFAQIIPDTRTLVVTVGGSGAGTVTSSPPGIHCSAGSCEAEFDINTSVTLTANPGANSELGNWSGACGGSGGCTVTMSQDRAVGALFTDTTVQHTLEVLKVGSGFVFSPGAGGINCGATCSGVYNDGTVINLSHTGGSAGWVFSHWEGGPCQGLTGTSCPVTMNQDHLITAVFVPNTQRSLSVVRMGDGRVYSDPEGIDCGGSCSSLFEQNTEIALHAVAQPGWRFVQWSGGACAGQTEPLCELQLAADTEVTATFEVLPPQYSLAASVEGGGRLISDPGGINCPAGSCTALFDPATQVQINVVTAASSTFLGWTEGPCEGTTVPVCSFSMDEDITIAAEWTPILRNLSISLAGDGSGTISSLPEGVDCNLDCQHQFPSGLVVELIATPAPGSVFSGWDGDCEGEQCTLTMSAHRAVTALFTQIPPEDDIIHRDRFQQ